MAAWLAGLAGTVQAPRFTCLSSTPARGLLTYRLQGPYRFGRDVQHHAHLSTPPQRDQDRLAGLALPPSNTPAVSLTAPSCLYLSSQPRLPCLSCCLIRICAINSSSRAPLSTLAPVHDAAAGLAV